VKRVLLAILVLASAARALRGPSSTQPARPSEVLPALAKPGPDVSLGRALRSVLGGQGEASSDPEGAEAGIQDPAHRPEVLRWVAETLEEAYGLFDEHRHVRCVQVCDRILLLDPRYDVAVELRTFAQRAQHGSFGKGAWEPWLKPWKEATWAWDARIPHEDRFRMPDRVTWRLFRRDLAEPTIAVIHRTLETRRIDFDCEGAKLEDVLAFVRDDTGLNLILDARVRGRVDPEAPITFKVKGMSVANSLRLLLSQFRLTWVVTEEGVVLLTD
jgi:hypothetical protein